MPFTGDSFAHLFDWEKDPQRQEKIVNARLEAEFDGLDTGLSAVAARATAAEAAITAAEAAIAAIQAILAASRGANGWVAMDGSGAATNLASFNVSGITDNGPGDYTVTWDTDFSSASYAVVGSVGRSGSAATGIIPLIPDGAAIAAGSVRMRVADATLASLADAEHVSVVAFGNQ